MKANNNSLKLLATLLIASLAFSSLFLTSCDGSYSSASTSASSESKSFKSSKKETESKKADIDDDEEDDDGVVGDFVKRWNSSNPNSKIKKNRIKYYEDGNGAAAKVTIGSIICEFSGYEGHDTFSILSKKLPLTEEGRKKFLKQATKAFAAYYGLTQKKAKLIMDAFSNGKAGKRSDYMTYCYKNYDLVLNTTALEGYNYDLSTDKDSPMRELLTGKLS